MKKIALSVLVVLSAVLLAACQNREAASPPASAQAPASESASPAKPPVEITFWYAYGGNQGKANEELVKQFNESQDEVKVTAQFQGENYNALHAKLQAAVAAKNGPDVTVIENLNTGPFANAGILQDLTGFIERDQLDLADFVPSMLGNSYLNDKFYAFPYLRSTNMLYFNKTMVEEAGLDPAGPKTWDELAEYARKLTVPGERSGITAVIDFTRYESFVLEAGGSILTEDGAKAAFNGPEGVAALEFWMQLNEEKTADLPFAENSADLVRQNFINQRAAMFIQSSSWITTLTEAFEQAGAELGATIMPAKVNHGSTSLGSNIAMLAGLPEEKREAAWKFIKWMTDTEQTIASSLITGYQPTRRSAVDSPKMQQVFADNPLFKVASEQMEHATSRPMVLAYNEIGKTLNDQIQKALQDPSYTAQKALDEAAETANDLLSH